MEVNNWTVFDSLDQSSQQEVKKPLLGRTDRGPTNIESTFSISSLLKRSEVPDRIQWHRTFWWRKSERGVNDGNRIASNFTWSKSFQWRKSQTNLALSTNFCSSHLFFSWSQTLSGDERQQCSSSDIFIRAATKTHLNLVSQDGRVAEQREDDADCRGGGGGGGDRHLKAEGEKRSPQKEEH